MNQQEYMNRIYLNQVANQAFLISLQYQPLLFQYIPQIYCSELTQQNIEMKYERNNCNGTIDQEQQYQSNPQQAQVLGGLLNIKNETEREIKEKNFNGHWSKQEHEQYLEFVNNHLDIMKSKYDKKSKKIFKLMSQFIPSRSPTQCRSHHQKFNPLHSSKKKKNSRSVKY